MQRLAQIHDWLTGIYPDREFTLAPASADASFRRYFRASFNDHKTLIVMDAPPEHEDCKPFIRISQLFGKAGANVPEVLAQDLDRGFLLLTDLGATTYLAALNTQNADQLYRDAASALVTIQCASRPGVLPDYDEVLLTRELQLFPDWYIAKHLGVEVNPAQQAVLQQTFALLNRNILAQGQVLRT